MKRLALASVIRNCSIHYIDKLRGLALFSRPSLPNSIGSTPFVSRLVRVRIGLTAITSVRALPQLRAYL